MSKNHREAREWLIRNLRAKGRGAKSALAKFLKVRPEAITRMTSRHPRSEGREINANELLRMAEFFNVPPPGSADFFDSPPQEKELVNLQRISVVGGIGAGNVIDTAFEQTCEGDQDDAVELNLADDMIGFRVKGDSMLPKYDEGDIIIVRREARPASDLVGEEAALRTHDGRRYIKRIMHGPKPNTYNLESLNAPTIVGARIAWASIVRIVLKGRKVRRR